MVEIPTVKLLDPAICTNYTLLSNEKLISISIPTSKDPNGIGIVGILTVPPLSLITEEELIKNPTNGEKNYPPTHKLALILHGKGGHKNYCYQDILAQKLAAELGIYSFRIDFRGCGDSQDNEYPEKGRPISQDIVDINLCLDILTKGASYDVIGINLVPNSMISHSRGAVAMFQWALEEQAKFEKGEPSHYVPNLVNTSSRYVSNKLLQEDPNIDHNPFSRMTLKQYRLGKYEVVKTPKEELIDIGTQDLSLVKNLDEEIQVLSIYGLSDHIVPVEDSSHFANLLGSRHTLNFIPFADHNFYGDTEINESNVKKFNPFNYPLKRNRTNWNYKVTSDIIEWLHSLNDITRFRNATKVISYYPRWRNIDGVSNFRDLGGWKTKDNKYVKAGILFRSANPSNVTELGKKQLRELGITTFFDLRSISEFEKAGGLDIEGIDCRNIPIYKTRDLSPQAIAKRYRNLLISWYTYKYVYRDTIKYGVHAFVEVFNFIRDNPDKPFVFNCYAGKDRTGVVAMLILLLLRVDPHTVAKEYELTTIGLVAVHDVIRNDFLHFADNAKTLFNEDPSNPVNITPEDMFQNLISSKYESMIATIEIFNNEYGGIDEYMINHLGYTEGDLSTIRKNLLSDRTPYPTQNSIWRHRSTSSSLL